MEIWSNVADMMGIHSTYRENLGKKNITEDESELSFKQEEQGMPVVHVSCFDCDPKINVAFNLCNEKDVG